MAYNSKADIRKLGAQSMAVESLLCALIEVMIERGRLGQDDLAQAFARARLLHEKATALRPMGGMADIQRTETRATLKALAYRLMVPWID